MEEAAVRKELKLGLKKYKNRYTMKNIKPKVKENRKYASKIRPTKVEKKKC